MNMPIKNLFVIIFTALFLFGCNQPSVNDTTENTKQSEAQLPTKDESDSQPLFDGLGPLQMDITTASPTAQKYFNQGMMLAWGFNHAAADLAFNEGAINDPD